MYLLVIPPQIWYNTIYIIVGMHYILIVEGTFMSNIEKIKENKNEQDGSQAKYLQMIQSAIDRMSTSSALFKGFAAAIMAGMVTVSFTEISIGLLVCSIAPIILFAVMDIYYLQLERRFRYLYNQVRLGMRAVDFDMTPPTLKEVYSNYKTAKLRWYHCLQSPSIWLFYGPLFVASGILIWTFLTKNPVNNLPIN